MRSSLTAVAVPLASLLFAALLLRSRRHSAPKRRKKLKESERVPLPSGLVNVGNSCYLSSVLQLLASCGDPLISHFRNCENRIASTLSDLLESINKGEATGKLRPIEFIESFSGMSMGLSPDQQDAHEFLLVLLNMKSKQPRISSDSINLNVKAVQRTVMNVSNPFTGVLMNELICLPCAGKRKTRHISSLRIEPFSCITLTPNSNVKISEAVYRHFCAPERYSDYCNYKNSVSCGHGAVNQKHPLILPRLLFLHVSLITGESFLKSQQVIETETNLGGPGYRYKLISVIVHYGESGKAGHFICFRRYGKAAGWIECNDESVRIVPEERVLAQRAYILLYETEEVTQ